MFHLFRFLWIVLLGSMLSTGMLFGQNLTSAGFGFRGNYWDVAEGNGELLFRNLDGLQEVSVGGFGGSIYFFSRIDEQSVVELSFGAIGAVKASDHLVNGENVDAVSVMPLVMGLRYQILPAISRSALQPYLQFGGGAYWVSDIRVRENFIDDEEVRITSRARPGGYAGIGLDFNLGRHAAINYDLKYHWVDFEREGLQNGFQFGIGLSLMWGNFRHQ